MLFEDIVSNYLRGSNMMVSEGLSGKLLKLESLFKGGKYRCKKCKNNWRG